MWIKAMASLIVAYLVMNSLHKNEGYKEARQKRKELRKIVRMMEPI